MSNGRLTKQDLSPSLAQEIDNTTAQAQDLEKRSEELTAQLAETIQKVPWVAVNEFNKLHPESNDTGRVQRAIDTLNGGVLRFDGSYLIGSINLKSNTHLIGTRGTTLTFTDASMGFNIDNLVNVSFYDFEMDGTNQITGSNYMIKGINSENIIIDKCHFKNGRHGVFLQNVKNGIIDKCIAINFRMWAFYVEGCDGFKYLNNISNNGAYDGLKMGGLMDGNPANTMRNIEVAHNYCFGNQRDGFDLAGNNVEIVNIHNNQFIGNTLQGIDFKLVYQGSYMRNIKIHDNQCLNNLGYQINVQVGILDAVVEEVYIYDNELKNPNTTSTTGIRLSGLDDNCYVYDNQIISGQYGIRLIDSSKVNIHSNIIKNTASRGILLELQVLTSMDSNVIQKNEIYMLSGECIAVLHAGVTNTEIFKNKNKTLGTGNRISDLGTGTKMYLNEAGYSDVAPTGRATKGEIWWNSDPSASEYMGWVATTSSGSATYKGFGAIQA